MPGEHWLIGLVVGLIGLLVMVWLVVTWPAAPGLSHVDGYPSRDGDASGAR